MKRRIATLAAGIAAALIPGAALAAGTQMPLDVVDKWELTLTVDCDSVSFSHAQFEQHTEPRYYLAKQEGGIYKEGPAVSYEWGQVVTIPIPADEVYSGEVRIKAIHSTAGFLHQIGTRKFTSPRCQPEKPAAVVTETTSDPVYQCDDDFETVTHTRKTTDWVWNESDWAWVEGETVTVQEDERIPTEVVPCAVDDPDPETGDDPKPEKSTKAPTVAPRAGVLPDTGAPSGVLPASALGLALIAAGMGALWRRKA